MLDEISLEMLKEIESRIDDAKYLNELFIMNGITT